MIWPRKKFHHAALSVAERELRGEQEILANRFVIGTFTILACVALRVPDYIVLLFVGFLLCNAMFLVAWHVGLFKDARRFGAILLDAVMAGAIQIYDPAAMAFVYPLYLWATLGNGFRYGNRWLAIATMANVLSFSAVVGSTSYWQQMPVLSVSLLTGLVVIPLYCSKLIAKLSRATFQAETANRAKTYFLASISHELRTPLNAIIGYATQLQEENLSPRVSAMVHSSHTAAEHLLYLIEQLLYASKSESMQAPMAQHAFTLPDLLAEAREILGPQIADRGLEFRCHAEPGSDRQLIGPSEILRTMIVNLGSNAIKFTDRGRVVVDCGIQETPDGPELWFAVEDSGVGIAAHAQERIFEPFVQADETVLDQFGGTGLGLAICKQFAERMGGTLTVESELGCGSRFIYRGPAQLAGPLPRAADEEAGKLICFGPAPIAPTDSDVLIDWRDCATVDDLLQAIDGAGLERYDIAIVSDILLDGVADDHPIWRRFAEARTPAVLHRAGDALDLTDLRLRAAFATVIPAQPNFAQLRSAVRIGYSFGWHGSVDDAPENAAGTQLPPRKVLVADDNRTNREVLRTMLESAGHEVHLVVDGEEALAALESEPFDIVFLDINMPRMSGLEVCALWRQIEGPRHHVPILSVTADATDDMGRRSLDAGMDARLTKPIRRAELLQVMAAYCPAQTGVAAAAAAGFAPLAAIAPGRQDVSAVLDAEQVQSLLDMGGAEFFASLSESFCEDVETLLIDLDRSASARDIEAFRFAAHAIKSSAANIGAAALAASCGRMEKIAAPDFGDCGAQLAAEAADGARLVELALAAVTAEAVRAA